MIRVIEESHKEYMTPREIADEINKRRLYEKGDGQMILQPNESLIHLLEYLDFSA